MSSPAGTQPSGAPSRVASTSCPPKCARARGERLGERRRRRRVQAAGRGSLDMTSAVRRVEQRLQGRLPELGRFIRVPEHEAREPSTASSAGAARVRLCLLAGGRGTGERGRAERLPVQLRQLLPRHAIHVPGTRVDRRRPAALSGADRNEADPGQTIRLAGAPIQVTLPANLRGSAIAPACCEPGLQHDPGEGLGRDRGDEHAERVQVQGPFAVTATTTIVTDPSTEPRQRHRLRLRQPDARASTGRPSAATSCSARPAPARCGAADRARRRVHANARPGASSSRRTRRGRRELLHGLPAGRTRTSTRTDDAGPDVRARHRGAVRHDDHGPAQRHVHQRPRPPRGRRRTRTCPTTRPPR